MFIPETVSICFKGGQEIDRVTTEYCGGTQQEILESLRGQARGWGKKFGMETMEIRAGYYWMETVQVNDKA